MNAPPPTWSTPPSPPPARPRDPTALAVVALVVASLSLLLQLATGVGRLLNSGAGKPETSTSPAGDESQPSESPGTAGSESTAGSDVVFTTVPLPPASARQGFVATVKASGNGNGSTPPFTLSASSIGGGMGNNGTFAVFWVVPAGQRFDETKPPTASCTSGCASGGWANTVNPGKYYLVVRADAGWSFEISQTFPQSR